MPKLSTAQTSTQNVFKNQAQHNRAINGIWRDARNAPMFSKKVVSEKSGKESTRHMRLINTLAYKIAVSGACAGVSGVLESEMESLGMNVLDDNKNRPFSCSMAPGAAMLLEQFLASIVQQIIYNTKIMRNGLKKHSRINKTMTRISIGEVKKAIIDPASGIPLTTTVLPLVLSRKKKEGETEAPGDAEAVDPAAEDAEEAEDGDEAEGAEDAEDAEDAEE